MTGSQTNEKAKWGIMVYMVADGPLANFAVNSLNQLQAAATDGIVVAAQFAPKKGDVLRMVYKDSKRIGDTRDTNGTKKESQRSATIYRDDTKKEPLERSKLKLLPGADMTDMTHQKTLTEFINWASRECNAERYCLFLWGHGPELLFESPTAADAGTTTDTQGAPTSQSASSNPPAPAKKERKPNTLYFTPAELAKALKDTDLAKAAKQAVEKQALGKQRAGKPAAEEQASKAIEIIGLDACSMAMVEFAYELRGHTRFMISSQEEVPDFSFPYSAILKNFKDNDKIEDLCKAIVGSYSEAYKDYIFDYDTNTAPVTLSALDLEKMETITNSLQKLVSALTGSSLHPDLAKAVYGARRHAQGFAGGLFVDLAGFCDRLKIEAAGISHDLVDACASVSTAIRSTNVCVLANKGPEGCHGLSIYFPYLQDGEKHQVERPLVKGPGGDTIGKTVSIINTAAADAMYAIRQKIIQDTEIYYRDGKFKFAQDSCWYGFIQREWSRILAEKEPYALDLRYWAEQCAQNLLSIWAQDKRDEESHVEEPDCVGAK